VQTSVCLLKNGNGKQKFVFLGRQMINGNRRLLFQQTCPFTYVTTKELPPIGISVTQKTPSHMKQIQESLLELLLLLPLFM
jgi:hypothetical protein